MRRWRMSKNGVKNLKCQEFVNLPLKSAAGSKLKETKMIPIDSWTEIVHSKSTLS